MGKINKPIGAILVILLAPAWLIADITDEITIEVKSGIFGAWTKYGGAVSSYTNWRFYRGFEVIPESEFLEIAGYEDQAEESRARAERYKLLMGIAWGFVGVEFVAGGYMMYHVYEESNYRLYDPARERHLLAMDVGFAGMVVAAGVAGILGLIADNIGENSLPLELAHKIAEEYNASLSSN